MKRKDFIVFCLMTVLAGMAIGLGGTASLLANNLSPDMAGRLIGALLFGLGLLVVIVFEMKLFTGMVAGIPTMGVKNLWKLAVCFIGNSVGMAILALLVYYTFIGHNVAEQGALVIGRKLADSDWAIRCFCSAVLCGMLITFSVKSVQAAPKKGLSATLGVVLPVVVFAFCGFDHSVANMLYLYFYVAANGMSLQILWYALIAIAGNVIGGVLLPYCLLLKEKWKVI